MNEQDAKLLQMTANTDQVVAGLKNFATAHRAYFTALREQGFTIEQAMRLVVNYQQVVLSTIMTEKRDGDDRR